MEILGNEDGALGVTELGKRLDVDKSTAYRLVATLEDRGYVIQDPETAKYRLGLKIVELGGIILDKIEIRREAAPFLKELVRETNEAVHLAVLMDDEVVYIDQERSPAVITVNTGVGRRALVHCTATGKVLTAFLPDERLERIIKHKGLPRFTPRTITSPEALRIHLAGVRDQGYAVDDEELTPGVRCVAVPVRNHRGKIVATIGISGPSSRISLEQIPHLAGIARRVGDKISGKLGWEPARAALA